jgi:hypothetical protein
VLARDLGMTVAELRARMDVGEFKQWQVLYGVEAEEHEEAMKRVG